MREYITVMLLKVMRSDIHWLIFYFFVILSWLAVLFSIKNAAEIVELKSIYGADFWIELCSQAAGFDDIFSIFLMWVIMSGAMMMPTLVPTLRTYQDLIYTGAGNSLGFIFILFGFLIIWIGYSAITSVFQAFLIEVSFVDQNGKFINPFLSSGVLAGAGLYQFSRFKNACASKCRAPLTFFMEFWSEGRMASFKMGLRLGLSCLGCCWMLMLLAFVGGTMSLVFMGLATVIMVLEKLPKLGDYISKPLGYMLIFSASLNVILNL